MPRSDYLMRIVQQFSKALAALLAGTRSQGREPTCEELDELSQGFAGFDLATLEALDADQILQLYAITGALDVEKAYVAGVLLYQLGRIDSNERAHEKALRLLEAVREEHGEHLNDEHRQLLETLRERRGRGG